jgi:HD superfamily phosphohydrolase
MIVQDDIWGDFEIKEKVLIELLNSQAIQRLKNIDQAGYSKGFFTHSRNRYDHSVGVFLLLRKYGGSLEEQIAGLIHDISHYAFSHAIDYILKEGDIDKQDLQDRSKERFLEKSNIPEILGKYGYDSKYIANEENFSLLENSLPDICADRIEYSIRDIILFLEEGRIKTSKVLSHLKVKDNNTWYFDNVDISYEYAKYFKDLNDNFYAGFKSAIMFKSIKDFVKYALEKEYICTEDLEEYDQYVLDKCLKYVEKDKLLKKYWERMNNSEMFYEDKDNYEEIVYCKSRVVDPICLVNDEMKKVSEVYKDWGKIVKEDSIPRKYYVAVRD